MECSIEKVKECFVLASIDAAGKTVYLKYLLGGNWEITTDIERASKMDNYDWAKEILCDYYFDIPNTDDKFVIVPLKITWELVKQDDVENN